MYRFILKRLLMLIPVLLGVSFIVYTILSFTPGDPVQMMLGDNYSEESYAAMQEELGLDDPFLVQYGRFIINAVHGDFGTSYSTGNPVAAEIAARLPNTILLSACAMLFAILIGIPLGVISATHQYSAVDNISMLQAKPARLREIRGSKISVIFQDPMTSLNPVYSVGDQIAEVIHQHEKCSKEEGRRKAGDMLEMVGIPRARYDEYPHQFTDV